MTRDSRRRGGRGSGPVLTEHGAPVARTPWAWIVVLLVVGGAYAWWADQRQLAMEAQMMAEVRAARDAAQRELAELRNSLSVTGENLSETEAQTGGRLQVIDSEIRKLWDVANKRNRGWIEDNEAALAELGKAGQARQKRLAALESWRKTQDKATSGQSRKLAALEQELGELRKANEQLRAQNKEQALSLQTRVDQVAAQLGQASGTLRKLQQQLQDAMAPVSGNTQSIESINAFRRQTMQSLSTLQSAVSNLQREVEQMRQPY